MIEVTCECGEVFRADETHIGYSIRCRNCKRIVSVRQESRSPKSKLHPARWPRFHRFIHALSKIFKRFRGESAKARTIAPRPVAGTPIPDEFRFAKLKSRLDKLAKDAWKSQDSLSATFLLNPSTLPLNADRTIEAILDHVRQIASGLSVPHKVPRIETGSLVDAGGQFKVSDGWVSLKLANHLLMDRPAVRAILAHELSHYVLENSGIRETDSEQNERLTDLCMFVCGLGELFLQGYKRENAQSEYRLGHRLGYLTDAEYRFVDKYVLELRSSNTLGLPTKLDEVKRKFAGRVGDSLACERLINNARMKYPEKSEMELYEMLLEQFDR